MTKKLNAEANEECNAPVTRGGAGAWGRAHTRVGLGVVAAVLVTIFAANTVLAQEPAPPTPPAPKPADAKEKPTDLGGPSDFLMRTPTDAYEKLLAGKKLEERIGFPGIVVVGDALPKVMQRLGPGREEAPWFFWYFYEKGSWNLTVCTSTDDESYEYVVQALIMSGVAAPPTKKGVKIGDPVTKLTAAYGKPGPFTGSLVGLAHKGKTVSGLTFENGRVNQTTRVIEEPEAFQEPIYYAAERLAFAVSDGYIDKIALVRTESPLPRFLRATVKEPTGFLRAKVAIDAKLTRATLAFEEDKANPRLGRRPKISVPAAPTLTPFACPDFSLNIPKGWVLEQTAAAHVWKSADGAERVALTRTKVAADEALDAAFARMEPNRSENMLSQHYTQLPADFCRLLGARDGWAYSGFEETENAETLPRATFGVVLRKGEQAWLLLVTRQAHPTRYLDDIGAVHQFPFVASPDGEALARGVIRSLRILK